jgi:hypothetical protein
MLVLLMVVLLVRVLLVLLVLLVGMMPLRRHSMRHLMPKMRIVSWVHPLRGRHWRSDVGTAM